MCTITPEGRRGSTRLSSRSTSLPGHQDVARIHEQHVAAAKPVEHLERHGLNRGGDDLNARQAGDVGARRGVDGEDLAHPAQRPGEHASRMARADLDQMLRLRSRISA
jgi:hypothetical protein